MQAVVDLPTPPLPDATAMTCVTPGMIWARGEGACAGRPGVGEGDVAGPLAAGRSAVRLANTPETPGSFRTAASAASRAGSARRRLARIDRDREHDPAGRVDQDLRQPPGRGEARAALAERHGRERLQDLFAGDRHSVAPETRARGRGPRRLARHLSRRPSRVRAAATKPGVVRCSVPKGARTRWP